MQPERTDLVPLLPRNNAAPTAGWQMRTLQMLVAMLGTGIVTLYITPSQECADSDSCGEWLNSAMPEEIVPYLLFASGAFGVGALETYFAALSVPKFVEFLKDHKDNKVLAALGLLFSTITQCGQAALVAAGTGSADWIIALSFVSAIPSTLFALMGTLKRDLPYLRSRLSTDEEDIQLRKIQKEVLKQSKLNLNYIIRNCNAIPEEVLAQEPWDILLSFSATEERNIRIKQFIKPIAATIGAILALVLLMSFGINTYVILSDFPILRHFPGPATGILLLSTVYNIIRLMVEGFNTAADRTIDMLTGTPTTWLALHTNPKSAIGFTAFNVLFESFSFATLCLLFEARYNEDWPARDFMRVMTCLAIVILHCIPTTHLYELAREKMQPTDSKSHRLTQLSKEVQKVEWMTSNQYRMFTNNPLGRNSDGSVNSSFTFNTGSNHPTLGSRLTGGSQA